MSVRLNYRDVAPGAAEDSYVTATGAWGGSTPSLLPFGSGNSKRYATAERNLWALDGTFDPYDGGNVAFWSNAISDRNGYFSYPPSITVYFGQRYTSPGISFVFSGDAWCSRLSISWYQGSTLLDSADFTPNAMEYFCSRSVTSYDRITIAISQTSLPYRRARIDTILFGVSRTFLRDELRSVKLVQEIDPVSRELAENVLDWTLSSKQDVDYIFQFKQPVYAYDDNTLLGVGYIEDSNRVGTRIYDIVCTDAIGVLDNEPFPDAYYSGENALTLAQSICNGFTVDMQMELRSKTVKGIIKGKTRRGALQQLCFALGAVADTSGTDAIKIFTLPDSSSYTEIGADRIRTGGSVTTNPITTEVRLTAHSYSTSGSTNEVEINGVKYYDTQTVVSIANPDVTASDKANVVDISDATLVSPENVSELAQRLYDHYARRNTHKLKFRLRGETVGDFVQTVTPWETNITGYYVKGSLTLSGFVLSDAEVVGA